MFADDKIRLIESMPEADAILIIWIKLLIQAGKTNANGFIFLNKNIPFSPEMISTLFNRPISVVRLALNTLSDFGMISIDETGRILIENWEKHQNQEGMEKIREQNRQRQLKFREKRKFLTQGISNVTVVNDTDKKVKNVPNQSLEDVSCLDAETQPFENESKSNDFPQENVTVTLHNAIDKEEEKEKKKIFDPNSDEFRLSSLLFNKIKERDSKHKEPNLQKWSESIEKLHRIDKREFSEIETVIEWSQANPFWKNNILSTGKLREKFEQLYLQMKSDKSQQNIPEVKSLNQNF